MKKLLGLGDTLTIGKEQFKVVWINKTDVIAHNKNGKQVEIPHIEIEKWFNP